MALVFLLAVGICILLLFSALALFLVPVVVLIAIGRRPGSASAMLQASWGFIGARARREGGDTRVEYLFLGRPFHTRAGGGRKAPQEQGPKGTRPVPSPPSQAWLLLKQIGQVSAFGGRLLHTTTLQRPVAGCGLASGTRLRPGSSLAGIAHSRRFSR